MCNQADSGSRVDPDCLLTQDFAQQLVEHLEAHRSSGDFGSVVLAAPPLMLAALRKQMARPLSDLVVEEFDKDYTELSAGELQRRLAANAHPVGVR